MKALSRRRFLTGGMTLGFLTLAGCADPRDDGPKDAPQSVPQAEAGEAETNPKPGPEAENNPDIVEDPV